MPELTWVLRKPCGAYIFNGGHMPDLPLLQHHHVRDRHARWAPEFPRPGMNLVLPPTRWWAPDELVQPSSLRVFAGNGEHMNDS